MALLGGAVLLMLAAMLCLSVLGQGIERLAYSDALAARAPGVAQALQASGLRQIGGDFELVEAGLAFAVFAFLPLCQLRSGHATVEVFTAPLGRRANLWLRAFWEVVLALALCVVAWRLGAGTLDKAGNGQTTFLLQFPVWWAYAASLYAAAIAAAIAVWCAAVWLWRAARGVGDADADPVA